MIDKKLHIHGRLRRALSRLRHKRGHGVHSPYVYSIYREVFMRRRNSAPLCAPLYQQLIDIGVDRRNAAEIENLRHHCGFSTFGVDTLDSVELVVCTEVSAEIVAQASQSGITVVILLPLLNAERKRMCEDIIECHTSTTILRKKYLVIFNNHLPKQHFTL